MSNDNRIIAFIFETLSKVFCCQIIFYYSILIRISLCQEERGEIQIKWRDIDILPANYSRDNAPVKDGQPVDVYIAITVLSLMPNSNADMVSKGSEPK